MDKDSRLPLAIGGVLVAIIIVAVAIWKHQDAGRPVLIEARVVFGSSSDPVLSDTDRTVAHDEEPVIAVALKVTRRGKEHWLAPASEIVIDGVHIQSVPTVVWPEEDRFVRVFWFTVECDHMGGELTADNAESVVNYRAFLASELGRGILADVAKLEPQNDDQVAPEEGAQVVTAGTFRLYARVEVVDDPFAMRSLQSAVTIQPNGLWDGSLITMRLHLDSVPGINSVAGELFALPGFEVRSDAENNSDVITLEAVGHSYSDLIGMRILTSSHAFASLATTGRTTASREDFTRQGTIIRQNEAITMGGAPVRWGSSITAGDLLNSDRHWIVLVSDDGNGVLDGSDLVAHCWRRPPSILPLVEALEREENRLVLLRYAQ
ncbi:MAG: hypothetical protein GY906_05825 [bacterium]|nr:hypothetical protein [bacterium]